MRIRTSFVAAIVLALVAVGCGGDDDAGGGDDGSSTTQGSGARVITVASARGMQRHVNRLVNAYQRSNEQVTIEVEFYERPGLREAAGAEGVDVVFFPNAWETVTGDAVRPLGRNPVVIATPPGNPANVQDVGAFAAERGLRVRVCGPEGGTVGNLVGAVLTNNGITPAEGVVAADCETEAADQLAAGELDAALMFRASLRGRDDVAVVEIPDESNVVIDMSFAVLGEAERVQRFGEFVAGERGQRILTQEGLLP